MARSIKLGHCVCNPKKPCPCDVFKEHNVCSCAGEKIPVKTGDIALTKYVRKAGCASKIGQADLLRILGNLPPVTDPNVLVGTAAGDDAGIYRLDERTALVQTVDVFSPCVDDPHLFGRIAAANSLSDVYAMGGHPLTALSIVGFPIDDLDGGIMEDMLRGGMETLDEAKCSLVGGHSINDEEIKCGFAITGLIDPSTTVERDSLMDGDVLVLTKPLGTGIVCFAAQIGSVDEQCLSEVGASMATLNRDAAELMVEMGAHACTDVTGFGLAGHLAEMVRRSGAMVEIDMSSLPVFAIVKHCLENEVLPGAIERNREYSMAWIRTESDENPENLDLLFDPQTSGGLLVALPEDRATSYVAEMHRRGHTATSVVGKVTKVHGDGREGIVTVTNTKLTNFVGTPGTLHIQKLQTKDSPDNRETPPMAENSGCCDGPEKSSCCDSPPKIEETESSATLSYFKDFMKHANAEGLIDRRAKKLMAVALSVSQRCGPCLRIHIKGALAMGISRAEIDEAAHLAIAFAGCPALTLYDEVCREIYG